MLLYSEFVHYLQPGILIKWGQRQNCTFYPSLVKSRGLERRYAFIHHEENILDVFLLQASAKVQPISLFTP